ncbi:hypothetical protein BGW80DRAFT_657215 [Lactifluus volemus]|nr:hypothetical protein BGW80DRAFT_657215 [Lactifluus volemus]
MMGYAGAGGLRVVCRLSRARPNNSGLVQRAYVGSLLPLLPPGLASPQQFSSPATIFEFNYTPLCHCRIILFITSISLPSVSAMLLWEPDPGQLYDTYRAAMLVTFEMGTLFACPTCFLRNTRTSIFGTETYYSRYVTTRGPPPYADDTTVKYACKRLGAFLDLPCGG